ncbi:dynein axonemal heavy chain 10-like [Erpetoichthys calabaricus]|uniref:dynein axonemal heavy chain 10-like n=1 Tax=Erpetoichthys calabaricus TaxID=27687 RepID=UPI002234E334|nr:dynein axonemal heavy chain 10-like [Erpetoichthys calabaricus]
MRKWQSQIASITEEQKKTKPEELGLLEEIQFWHEWSIALRVLDEQLNGFAVKKIIDVLMLVDPATVQKFNLSWDMLKKYQMNAADNFKFLVILKHPFKNIDSGSGFFGIHDIIPQIMNRLKIIWIISNHYNDHERMMSIMMRIEGKLLNSVARVTDIHALFKQNRKTAMTILLQGKRILDGWKASYLKVCGEIENAHRYSLWTFDRQQLFERTDYMALICLDLHNILQTHEQLYSTFNASLRKLIGKPKRLNELSLWIERLIKPIEELNFDPFKLQEKNSWEKVMEKFENEVKACTILLISWIPTFLELHFSCSLKPELD